MLTLLSSWTLPQEGKRMTQSRERAVVSSCSPPGTSCSCGWLLLWDGLQLCLMSDWSRGRGYGSSHNTDDFTTHLIINPQAQFPSYHSSFDPGNILEGKWPTTLGSMNLILCTQAFLTCLKIIPLLQFSDSSLSQPFLCHIPV